MDKKDYCLKKIGRRGKIQIWLVDGAKIRKDIEPEFTNFGQHLRFAFIPKNEFYIDKEAVSDERRFFIDHLLVERRLMKKGIAYKEASDLADKKELSEREKSNDFKKMANKSGNLKPSRAHLRLLRKTKKGLKIWLINGKLVRNAFNIEFTEGGHDKVYKFVPENEIWIDNDLMPKERKYVILHELYERKLMNKGLTYCKAHRQASRLEWQARHGNFNHSR